MEKADTFNLDIDEKKILVMYQTLQKEGLLFSPFVDIRLDNGLIIKLYLEKSDYDRIKIHKRKELQLDSKKVRLKIQGKDLGNRMVVCRKLISIKKIEGKTLMVQKKLKIDDYN